MACRRIECPARCAERRLLLLLRRIVLYGNTVNKLFCLVPMRLRTPRREPGYGDTVWCYGAELSPDNQVRSLRVPNVHI